MSLEGYRFGYQGSEKDNEFKGEGNSYTTEFRQLDPRLGRWLSVDPLQSKYPWQNGYCSFDNTPILLNDIKGKESEIPLNSNDVEVEGISINNDLWSFQTNSTPVIPYQQSELTVTNSEINSPNWASAYIFTVHQLANEIGLKNCAHYNNWKNDEVLEKRMNYTLSVLNEATVWADGAQFQTSKYSFRHAMRNENQTITEAKILADDFVRKHYEIALNYWGKGETKLALYNLGVALHTLQDATSPAHGGFQLWTGKETKEEEIDHVSQELFYPGENSNLQKTTDWFIDLFFSQKPLPKGNLFDLFGHD